MHVGAVTSIFALLLGQYFNYLLILLPLQCLALCTSAITLMLSQDRQNADLDRFALGETHYHLLSCRLLFSHSFQKKVPYNIPCTYCLLVD